MDIITRIANWNRDRDNLKWNKDHEVSLLYEELCELQDAKSMENTAKEIADIIFVAVGTLVKFTGSPQRATQVLEAVIRHNEHKVGKKDADGKITKQGVNGKKCEPEIKQILQRKLQPVELYWEKGGEV